MPTFAEYVPVVSAAVTAGTRRAYGSYWNRVVEHWGDRRLDEPTPSEIRQLMAYVKAHVVARRNARGGRSAEEHLVAALRCLYQRAVEDGLIAEADNPARKVAKPRRLPSTRRAVPDTRLAEINQVAAATGDDPELDTLLLRLHTETACFSRGQFGHSGTCLMFPQFSGRSVAAGGATGVVQRPGWACHWDRPGVVELGHELSVGGTGSGEVFVAFFELEPQVEDLLFQVGDLLVEGVDVGGGAEPGLAPGLVAESLGQAFFQVMDAGAEPDGTFVCGEQVGLQRGPGDSGTGAAVGGRFGLKGVDLLQQVAVPVDEASCRLRRRGRSRSADLGPSAAARSSAAMTRWRRRAESAWRPSSMGWDLAVFMRWPPGSRWSR